ncbi:c-type cytochrome [Flavilitoribacter nigricans]|nr:c-type cytochrome [Flavilitoribacter nigricans]
MKLPTLSCFFSLLLLFFAACSSEVDVTQPSLADEDGEEEQKEIVYNIPEGFELEILFSPQESNQGSWVSLAEGENGTFYSSDQNGDLYQFKIPPVGSVLDSTQVDSIDLDIGHAQGLLWAFNSLYVSVNDRWEDSDGEQLTENGSGVYRLQDTDGDGELDKITPLIRLEGDGEHGPHSLVLAPDGESIYLIAGNHTDIPENVAKNSRLPNNWDEDNLFPPFLDARGHANHVKAPGGWIARFDPDGKSWELIAAGFRNPFDMAFNEAGELFAFDSDMEWDIGMPWYRPIRVCHVTSGAEFGWRTGSGKWPDYYPDNLPAVVNLGQGSPTAVLMGKQLDFPARYRNGLFVFDWSFGTAYFVDLQEDGSTYSGQVEEFFSGTPLPLTDAIAGSDGALYFATGGRKLESHLYRLRHTGPRDGEAKLIASEGTSEARELRRQLEQYHGKASASAIPTIWEQLNNADRFIRYAARIALEHQPFASWKSKLSAEKDTDRIIQSSIAAARKDETSAKPLITQKLLGLDWAGLSERQQKDYLRAIELLAIRLGLPKSAEQAEFINKLSSKLPSGDYQLDRELTQILIAFGDASATDKGLALLEKHTSEKSSTHPQMLSAEVSNRSEQYGKTIMAVLENMPPTEAIFYGTLLSHAEKGWSEPAWERYFNWFYDGMNAKGGMSFKPFLENIRRTAMKQVPDSLQAYYEELSGIYQPGADLMNLPQPEGPGAEYNSSDISRILRDGLEDEDNEYKGKIETGRNIYSAALCGTCHRMLGEGGSSGPDLTQLHTRFKRNEIITAIFSPNDEISDQYANTLLHLKDGKRTAGKIVSETDDKIILLPNPFDPTFRTEINKADVASRELSPVSPMPPNLLNRLNKEEIIDLFAFILAGGDEEHYYYGGTKGLEEKEKD